MQITPEYLAASGSEEGHQKALILWCNLNKDKYPELQWLFHIPNGGSRHKAEAAKFKAMGVKNGVPDLMLPVAKGSYHGLFIELKAAKGRISEDQNYWMRYLNVVGYCCNLCIGWEDARDLLIKYINIKGKL